MCIDFDGHHSGGSFFVYVSGKKNQVKSPSIWSRTPNLVRIRQSGRTWNRGVTSWYQSLGLGVSGRVFD